MPGTTDLSSLYSEFGARIYAYLRRLTRDDWLAEDLTQQTFLQAAQRLDAFRGEGKVSSWLYRIAANVLRDHRRKPGGSEQAPRESHNTSDDHSDAAATMVDPAPPVSQQLECRAATQCVHDCIEALPDPYRTALVLYAVEGKTVEESANILGCTTGAARVRLHRGRRLFKELADRHCEVSAGEDGGPATCLPKPPQPQAPRARIRTGSRRPRPRTSR
ncbi:MAG: RNA polymerase sigma factor [Deltaproteobacteria bacterium]|nr:RNA polymerase sigma factor [Deltaproteobacteria bacterium]